MKLIHLSDLHLGKRINEVSMIEEQKYILDKVIDIIKEEQPDVLLLAGDIYDRTVPSEEAVSLLDCFLTRISKKGIPIYLISGNHDSGERLQFGAALLKKNGIYFSTVYKGEVDSFMLKDQYGELQIHLLPFVKPAQVRNYFPNEKIENYNDALSVIINHMNIDNSIRNVIVAHQLITGAARTDSEEISIGGQDNCDAQLFSPFDYVALGHLHGPQKVQKENIRYCGTLLKYSFSEVNQKKSVTIVELNEKGSVIIRTRELTPLHDMGILKGSYNELMSKEFHKSIPKENYYKIILTEEEDIIDGAGRLSTVYPNVLQVDYDNQRTRESQDIHVEGVVESKSPLQHFEEFYEMQNNKSMDSEQTAYVRKMMESIWEEEK